MRLKIHELVNDILLANTFYESVALTVAKNIISAGFLDEGDENWEYTGKLKEMYNNLKPKFLRSLISQMQAIPRILWH